ncbi:MAG: DUF512 domain-containing protein [Clostridium fessum]
MRSAMTSLGKRITVAGLITAKDLIAQLKEQPLGEPPAASKRHVPKRRGDISG